MYVSVPGTKNERRTKILDTRDLDEAIIQAIAFKKEVKNNGIQKPIEPVQKSVPTEIKIQKGIKQKQKNQQIPELLVHAMTRYIGWLNNEDVPLHRQRIRTYNHIKDNERALKLLAECLKNEGYNLATVSIHDINDKMVGEIYSFLEAKHFSNRTFNKTISHYTSFINWFSDEYNMNMRNWFSRIKRKRLNPNPEAITRCEYEALLKQITLENGLKENKHWVKPTRNMYRPWLADGFKLALETGRRREEVINLKWNSIRESEGIRYIEVEDYKVNRIQNRIAENEKKMICIPITASLDALLHELGYNERINTDSYILAPNVKISRGKVMSNVLSRSFTHFYGQLNTGKNLTFKCLRKTYITKLQIYFSGTGNTKEITGHSDNQVIERNYIDKREIAKASAGFSVFSKEQERTEELKNVRIETQTSKQKNNKEVSL
jgi:integrase